MLLGKLLLLIWGRESLIKPLNAEEVTLLGEDWERLYEKPFYRRFSLGAAFWGPFWFLYYRMPLLSLFVVFPLYMAASIYLAWYRESFLAQFGLHFPQDTFGIILQKLCTEGIFFGSSIVLIGYGAPFVLRYKVSRVIAKKGEVSHAELTSKKALITSLSLIFALLFALCILAYLADPVLFMQSLKSSQASF